MMMLEKQKEIFRILIINVAEAILVVNHNKNSIRSLKIILDSSADEGKVLRTKNGALKGFKVYVSAGLRLMQYGNLKNCYKLIESRTVRMWC